MAILKDLIVSGVSRFIGSVFGSEFVVNGGTSSQFLKADGSLDGTTYCANNDSRLSNSRPASDVYSWAKASTKPSYTANEVGAIANIINTTWTNLKSLRDNSTLKAGQWYRITDYVTTTIQDNTQSAGHQFDIIVRADDVNVLNENAFATKHSGDTYFTNAGAKLEAWELKYSLDNNTNKFAWADATNGKGVIYWMKDEWNNECSYDFKNIQFLRYRIDSSNVSGLQGLFAIEIGNHITIDDSTEYWCYTFCMIDTSNNEGHDVTVEQDVYLSDDGYCYKNHSNIIKPFYKSYYDDDNDTNLYKMFLNNTVMVTDTDICYIEEGYGEFYGFYSNSFGTNCYDNTIGNGFYYNTIGNECYRNSIGNECYRNSIGNNYYYNTIGNNCYKNSIGNECYDNTIGNGFYYNTIGNDFDDNTIGNDFQYNTIGNNFNNNFIGNDFSNNSIGNGLGSNSIGNDFRYNSIGNCCEYIRIQKDYVYYIIIENGNQYIDVTSTKTTSVTNKLRNFTIAQGVNNTKTRKTISHNTVNDTFKTIYRPANSQEVSV